VLNKRDGTFDGYDEVLATTLAAQCAVALQRVRMTSAVIEGEKMRQALEMARIVQMSTLPVAMPDLPSYDACATFRPAELTGGDTYDLAVLDGQLLVVLGDATGHGIAPALSVTQMQAMLRMAFRLGADLDTAFLQVNNRLSETLADDRFITAFIGILDPSTDALRFHSGGQGPILLFRAADRRWEHFRPTSFPLGAMPLTTLKPPHAVKMLPGDVLAVISDGIYEYENVHGEPFGEARVRALIETSADRSMAEILDAMMASVAAFAAGAPQEDDMTAVLVKREPDARGSFPRTFDAIPALVQFTAQAFARLRVAPELLTTVDLAVEELFTNMVKYSAEGTANVVVELAPIPGGVELRLIDDNVERFDVTRPADVDIDAPLADRKPGGLGLHLIRRMADSVEYEYDNALRQSRITLRITGGRPASAQ
ncbi:MAG: SpoIIE family protein phosphatase, partial [bacterium]